MGTQSQWTGSRGGLLALVVALSLAAAAAQAHDGAAEKGAGAGPARDDHDARIERLEREIEALKAERETARRRREDAGAADRVEPQPQPHPERQPAAPDDPWLDEKFRKKWGEKAAVSWKEGFHLLFFDEEEPDPTKRVLHRFSLNGRLHADLRLFADDEHPQRNRFFLRRIRLNGNGTFYRYFSFMVEAEFGQSSVTIRDGYINVGFLKELQFRVGQFKEPFGLDHITSSRYLNFVERNMLQGTVAAVDFDMGAMVWGDLGFATWQLAVQNGTSTDTPDNNDDKDINARVVLHPFAERKGHLLEHLLLGGSFNYGHQNGFLGRYRTEGVNGGTNPSGRASEFFTYRNAAGGILQSQRGGRTRWGLEARLSIAPITVQGEYGQVIVEDIEFAGNEQDIQTQGAYVDVLYMITGEDYPWSKRVVPRRNFDLFEGGGGAWQVGLRWDWLRVERDAIRRLGASGANEVHALVVGINWYWNPYVKLQLNYNRNWFNDDPAYLDEDAEDAFLLRFAVDF